MIFVQRQHRLIAPQQRVRGQHEIVLANLIETFLALRAMQIQHPKRRRKLSRFLAPVVNQRGGQHDQRRPVEASRFLLDQNVRQRLHGLAEAHVIGENTRQIALAQDTASS